MTDPNTARLPPTLRDRYEVLRPLGAGGMGAVFLCRDTVVGRRVAVKVSLGDPGEVGRERFLREARTLAAIEHPQVVRVFDVGFVDAAAYIVMEYLEGRPCDQLAPGLDPLVTWKPVADALGAMHAAGVCHRDVKPANAIYVPRRGPVLIDFGLVLDPRAARLTKTGALVGTIGYLAPECLRGEEAGPAADWWAWGVGLYQLATGELPLTGEELLAASQGAPLRPRLERVADAAVRGYCEWALVAEPAGRTRFPARAPGGGGPGSPRPGLPGVPPDPQGGSARGGGSPGATRVLGAPDPAGLRPADLAAPVMTPAVATRRGRRFSAGTVAAAAAVGLVGGYLLSGGRRGDSPASHPGLSGVRAVPRATAETGGAAAAKAVPAADQGASVRAVRSADAVRRELERRLADPPFDWIDLSSLRADAAAAAEADPATRAYLAFFGAWIDEVGPHREARIDQIREGYGRAFDADPGGPVGVAARYSLARLDGPSYKTRNWQAYGELAPRRRDPLGRDARFPAAAAIEAARAREPPLAVTTPDPGPIPGPDSGSPAWEDWGEAALAGDAEAQGRLAYHYRRGAGVPKDPDVAWYWAARAARQDHPLGWKTLFNLREEKAPRAAPLETPEQRAEAVGWLRRGAALGDVQAMSDLGWVYERGDLVAVDLAEADRLYWAAAEAGNGLAARNTLALLRNHFPGSPKIPAAKAICLRAAFAGHPRAQEYWARDLLAYPGCPTAACRALSNMRAVAWITAAAHQGWPYARRRLDETLR